MKVLTKEQVFDDFAIFLELTDEQLDVIKKDYTSLEDIGFMKDLISTHGRNAHFIQVTLESQIRIREYIGVMLFCYDTVSWYNPDGKFHIVGKEVLCHQ